MGNSLLSLSFLRNVAAGISFQEPAPVGVVLFLAAYTLQDVRLRQRGEPLKTIKFPRGSFASIVRRVLGDECVLSWHMFHLLLCAIDAP